MGEFEGWEELNDPIVKGMESKVEGRDEPGKCTGGNSCCTPSNPCGYGEGDCDSHYDCTGAYYCGTNNCGQFNINGSFGGFDDCCVGSPKCNTGDNGCCDRGGYKCGYGEGDCDYDSDCAGNLHCGSNNCKQFGEIF